MPDETHPVDGSLRASPVRRFWLPLLLGLVTVGLATTCIWLGIRIDHHHRDAARRDQAITVAEQQALSLVTISDSNVSDHIAFLLAHSTGAFKTQLASVRKSFENVVSSGKVTSKGQVDLAAVSSATATKATVLLALSSTVSNSKAKASEARSYRLSVSLRWSGSHWLVSGMEFAP